MSWLDAEKQKGIIPSSSGFFQNPSVLCMYIARNGEGNVVNDPSRFDLFFCWFGL